METIYHNGTGESQCRTPESVRLRLHNIQLDLTRDLPIIFEVSRIVNCRLYQLKLMEENKNRHGDCNYEHKVVRLFRHDVLTLLHEYAHSFAVEVRGDKGHRGYFAVYLDMLIHIWLKKTGM